MQEQDEVSLFVSKFEAIGAPYMVTGATAAILYGQPRVTNDIDVVLNLAETPIETIGQIFSEQDFYVPPSSVIASEANRTVRGHFNIIHFESGFKADIYLSGADPLHSWAFERRRRIQWNDRLSLWIAPPEYVVRRKLQFFKEGRSAKHPTDIKAIAQVTGINKEEIEPWLARLGVEDVWIELGY